MLTALQRSQPGLLSQRLQRIDKTALLASLQLNLQLGLTGVEQDLSQPCSLLTIHRHFLPGRQPVQLLSRGLGQFDLTLGIGKTPQQQSRLETLCATQRPGLKAQFMQIVDIGLINKRQPWWRWIVRSRHQLPGRLYNLIVIALLPIASNMQSPFISFPKTLKALDILIRTIAFEQSRILALDTALIGIVRQRQNRPAITHHCHSLHVCPLPDYFLQTVQDAIITADD
ncbi:hypothetical protein [Pseudomonas cichorii]|uniref:hypothetical protein n=1 Tax=Pseudomonas cichorii TaxID=36746 RepID=UPI001C8A9BAE|nr:hypothetical protein [Pseudomonas cichorii]MBX8485549.1 hypothetical protein [Pseudomonas cichorii]MBX8514927.1 hypothetical protein [Pseudomonas cichorii]